jgi:tryptophanyl-tRNA synthetase
MSKSYDNTIPLWLPEKELRRAILGIVTNSQAPGEAKNPDESNLFAIYQAFASAGETAAMRRAYAEGIGWGDAKQKVFERVNAELAPLREKYDALIADPAQIEDRLRAGAARARELATPLVARLREAVGLRSLSQSSAAPEQQKKARAEKPALQPVVFRDGDAFAFKVLDAKKAILAEKGGFADPKAAMAAASEAMQGLDPAR